MGRPIGKGPTNPSRKHGKIKLQGDRQQGWDLRLGVVRVVVVVVVFRPATSRIGIVSITLKIGTGIVRRHFTHTRPDPV